MRTSDAALVERIRAGDPSGWTDLWEQHERRVYRFALRRLRDVHDAEDVRQEVFVEVMRSIDSYQGRSSLSTWILGIANHEVSSRYRARKRRMTSLEDVSVPELRDPHGDVDRMVDAARALARCTALVQAETSEPQRRVFELHVLGGGGAGSIGRSVGKTAQAVKISLFRTRRRLLERVAGLSDLLSA